MSTRTTSTTKISALDFHNRLIAKKGIEDASGFSERGRSKRQAIILDCLRDLPIAELKVLDYGCYDGNLFACLQPERGQTYIGVDINAAFIALARKRWKDFCKAKSARFILGDILTDETYSRIKSLKPDAIVASGVLCYKAGAESYPELVYRLFDCAQHTLIFNVLVNTKPKTKGIYVWNKTRVLRLIEACGCQSWSMIRNYLSNDMTVVMHKRLNYE